MNINIFSIITKSIEHIFIKKFYAPLVEFSEKGYTIIILLKYDFKTTTFDDQTLFGKI